MAYSNSMSGVLSDYTHLKTIPALLSVVFVLAGLYQFGGISSVEIVWASYTLTETHAMVASLGAYAIAFLSSETKNFEYYDDWEKVLILGGPALILAHTYSATVADLIATQSHLGPILAFLVTVASWAVAVR